MAVFSDGFAMITYHINESLPVDEFIAVLRASTLAERRPVDDVAVMEKMLRNANLLVTARADGRLVGLARTLTDFAYIAYMSDLAVDASFQRQGIGKELIRATRQQLGPRCRLLLLAAPAAESYYPHIGFEPQPRAYLLPADRSVG